MVRGWSGWRAIATCLEQNMIVLLMFYPVVFLITAWLEHPFLVGQLKLLHWSALFVDNVISVLLLSVVVLWRAGA